MSEEELTRRLAKADFSSASRVRLALRSRLLTRERPKAAWSPAWAAAAAAVLVAALPFALPSRRPATRFPLGEHGLPVLPGRLEPAGIPEPFPIVTRPTSLQEIFVKPSL